MRRNLVAHETTQAAGRVVALASLISGAGLVVLLAAIIRHLGVNGVFAPAEWAFLTSPSSLEFLALGALNTLKVAAVASTCCFVVASGLGWARVSSSRLFERLAGVAVICSGSIPLLLILYFLEYSFPWHGVAPDPFVLLVAGIVAFNVGPVAETLAAGMRSVDAGQRSSGLSLGLSPLQVELLVVAPQGVRRMLPALVTNFVAIVKDTSLGFVVPYADLLDRAQQLNVTQGARAPLLAALSVAALFYIAVGLAGSRLAQRLEARVDSGPVVRSRPSRLPVSWITLRNSR